MQLLNDRGALPYGAATVVAVMNSKDTHAIAIYLIDSATDYVCVSAYTFDLVLVSQALARAAAREVETVVVADRAHTFHGSTQTMKFRLQGLESAGVHVWLTSGEFGGIQHSKTLRSDDLVIVGSTNWTDSSARNTEASVLAELTRAGVKAFDKWKDELTRKATRFSDTRVPGQTESQTDRYRSARRFSIARSRSLEAARHYDT
jgi:phosphatidylserine/phosphatidylglycerophosphate/cardiolipin synthase-like enzyme